jgi:site-specific recombinase XerD
MERGLRPNTIRTYRSNLDRWVRFLEPKGWQEATSRDLERFLRRPVGPGLPRQGQALSVNVIFIVSA